MLDLFGKSISPYELLDIVNEENSIESYTFVSRKEHGFPYLVNPPPQSNVCSIMKFNKILDIIKYEEELLFHSQKRQGISMTTPGWNGLNRFKQLLRQA